MRVARLAAVMTCLIVNLGSTGAIRKSKTFATSGRPCPACQRT